MEVTNTVYVIASRAQQKQALVLVEQALEEVNYPTGDLSVAFGGNEVEIEATLSATSVGDEELDRVVKRLAAAPMVS